MPARRKRKSSEAAADAEAANKRAGVTVGNVAAAVQRLEAAEVEAPPLGEELPSRRHCAFCARPGNTYAKSHVRWIDWKLCRVLRTPGGGVSRSPPKKYFPVMGAIGDRPAELQPRSGVGGDATNEVARW
jgi:predicted component of type VI protein secretion system